MVALDNKQIKDFFLQFKTAGTVLPLLYFESIALSIHTRYELETMTFTNQEQGMIGGGNSEKVNTCRITAKLYDL